jgi:hypothetical protein
MRRPNNWVIGGCLTVYFAIMADEDTILEEAIDNLKGAGQRIKATQSLMRSEVMTDG